MCKASVARKTLGMFKELKEYLCGCSTEDQGGLKTEAKARSQSDRIPCYKLRLEPVANKRQLKVLCKKSDQIYLLGRSYRQQHRG